MEGRPPHLDQQTGLSHRFSVVAGSESTSQLSAASGGWVGACFLAVRLLALLMVIELSGLGHLALDLCELVSGADHHGAHEDCDDEGPGHECPPGCLNCHCAHAAVVIAAPRLEGSCKAVVLEAAQVTFRSGGLIYPSCADLKSIYRPPRSVA